MMACPACSSAARLAASADDLLHQRFLGYLLGMLDGHGFFPVSRGKSPGILDQFFFNHYGLLHTHPLRITS